MKNSQDQKIDDIQNENNIEMNEDPQEQAIVKKAEEFQDKASMGEDENIDVANEFAPIKKIEDKIIDGTEEKIKIEETVEEGQVKLQNQAEKQDEELFPVEDVESQVKEEKKYSLESDYQKNYVRGIVESLLFVNEKPITLEQIKKVAETVTGAELKKSISDVQKEYEENDRGIMIVEIAGGYQMLTNPKYASYIRNFYKSKHKDKLSKPALEALAIIAYKQPVTRSDIEIIRGVNSDGVVAHLVNKELIKIVGRKDVPGKPFLYGTTKQFLEYFGLKSLTNLPRLEEFPGLLPEEEKGGEELYNPDGTPMNTMEIAKQRAIKEADVKMEKLQSQVIPDQVEEGVVSESIEVNPSEENIESSEDSQDEELKKDESNGIG